MSTTTKMSTKRASWAPGDDTGALSTTKNKYLSPEYAPAPRQAGYSYHLDSVSQHHHHPAHPVYPNNHHLKNHLHHGGHNGHGWHLSYAAVPVSGHYYDDNATGIGGRKGSPPGRSWESSPPGPGPGPGPEELNGSGSGNGEERRGTHSLIRGGTSATPSPATTPVPIPGAIRRSLSISARGSSYNTQATATPGSFATVTEQQSQPQQYAEDNYKQLGVGSNNDNAGSSGNGAAVSTTHTSIAQSLGANSAIDPLSQQIFMRRQTGDQGSSSKPPKHLRNNSRPESPGLMSTGEGSGIAGRQNSDLLSSSKPNTSGGDVPKDKSKSKNFFLRSLTLRGRSSSSKYNDFDSDSEFGGDPRMNGFNARVFSQAVGYTPHHKEPPRYIRTKAANKKERDFGRVFLAQELVGTRPPGYINTQNTQQEGDKQEGGTNKGDAPGQGGGEANCPGGPTVTVSVASASGRKVAKTGGAIWATEFSRDGKYFAAAGKDNVVRVWAVISTPEERRAHEEEEAAAANGGNGTTGERLSAPVFRDRPFREFVGHSGEVLDLSWSKNNFLLSSSMDKTVRLWHISRQECLCTFKHKDFVTRLAFHPRDDRFFLAGSLDTILRLWSIPDKQIAFSAQCPDLITAVAFSPDGKTAIAGLLNGLCLFYETEGLKPQAQVHVRSSRGKNAKGSKITGIQTIAVPPMDPLKEQQPPGTGDEAQGEVKVLITSNDSRVRIYNLRDKSLEIKLKGHDNSVSQIAASFSDDGKYVICGSEDKKAFIWGLNGGQQRAAYIDKEKSPYEYFEAHGEMVTTAVFAPTKTRMLLGRSEDPIYDLCNPPPVVLRSAGEEAATASAHSAAASQTELSSEDHHQPVPPPPPPTVPTSAPIQRPEPSPAYIARSTHYDGNIIVTTDDTGIIKVFRQDCAYTKRKHDSWETGSTFSRKITSHGGSLYNGRLGRSISVLSRTSAGTGSAAHSRRGSISGNNAPYMVTSPVSHASALNQAVNAGSDRILSWRMGIENGADAGGNGVAGPRPGQLSTAPGNRSSAIVNGSSNRWSGVQTPTHSDRSLSPVRGGGGGPTTSSVPVVGGAGNRASMPAAAVSSVPSTPNRSNANVNINGTSSTPNGGASNTNGGYPHGHSHLATHTEANNSNLLESPANCLTPLNRVNTMGTGTTELGSPTRSVPMDITPERNRQAREREEKEGGRPGSPPAPGFSFRPARSGTGTGTGEERRGSGGPQDSSSDQHDGANGGGHGNGNGSGSGGISFWNPLKGMAGWKVGIPGFGKSSAASNSSGQRPGSSGLGPDKEGAAGGVGVGGKGQHSRSQSASFASNHTHTAHHIHVPSPLLAADGEASYGVSPGITPWDVPLSSSVQTQQSSGHGRRKSLGVFTTITGGNKGEKEKEKAERGEREVMRRSLPVGPLLATTDEDDDNDGHNDYANGYANGNANGTANGHARSQSSGTITGLQRPPLIIPTIINTRPSGDEEDYRPAVDEVLQQQEQMEREREILERSREQEREQERERSKERGKQRESLSKERQRIVSYPRMSWSRLGMGGLAGSSRGRANSDIAEREEEE